MARATDTRQRVREVADQLFSQGQRPTPTIIMGILGKGSPNTVVSELKAWNQNKVLLPVSPDNVTPASEASSSERSNVSGSADEAPVNSQDTDPDPLTSTLATLQELTAQVTQMSIKVDGLAAAPPTPTAVVETGMKAIEARFDGLQRYMLMQIHEAREDSVRWREKYKLIKEELGQWQTVLRQKLDAVNSENAWLKGRLNEPRGEPQSSETPHKRPAHSKPPMYSGHPRAVVRDDFESQE